ncbi:MAG: hypothetical protein ABSD74_09055 [Rhizomicrobium sp.]|jgi:hypothetical protein
MRVSFAARSRLLAVSLGLGASALALSGCGSVDEALFGSDTGAPASTAPATRTADASETPAASPDADTGGAGPAAPATVPEGLQLAAIEPGTDTGTTVGQTVQRLRGELGTIHDKVASDVQQFSTLRTAAIQDVTTYQEAKSHIVIRLQTGTTRANPELVNEWNTGQTSLDTLTGTINGFATLGTDLTTDAARIHTERETISDSMNIAGGTDEDHRQLTTLSTEAGQIAGVLDHLQIEVTRNVQRQTAFVANERASLAGLQSDIKNGELYTSASSPGASASLNPAASSESAKSIVTIRFNHAKVEFEQDLYAAMNQELQAKPAATFRVEAVSPTRTSEAAMQKVQMEAQHHAQDVLKSMTDMGLPAARVSISSLTDPSVTSAEVRVYAQ